VSPSGLSASSGGLRSLVVLLSYLSTGLSTVSLIVAALALYIGRKRIALPRRKLNDLELAIGDLDHDIASLRSTSKRLNARIGMREAREKAQNADPDNGSAATDDEWSQRPGETADQWKARLRRGPLLRGRRPADN
jgi:hypothetical protein